MWLGIRLPFLQISGGERGTTQGTTTEDATQSKVHELQARRPKTLNLKMTKAKQQWEAEMETLIVSQIQS